MEFQEFVENVLEITGILKITGKRSIDRNVVINRHDITDSDRNCAYDRSSSFVFGCLSF